MSGTGPRTVLQVEGLTVRYGQVQAVDEFDLTLHSGEVVALLGANGAGKSSTVRAIMGSVPAQVRRLALAGTELRGRTVPYRVRAGLGLVPEGRKMIQALTVEENLLLGGHTVRDRRSLLEGLARAYERFPILAERRLAASGALSGGEQQMLAIARTLMSSPSVLLLDEPTMGIAPVVVDEVVKLVSEIAASGVGVLVAEQNAAALLPIADRVVVLETGRTAYRGTVDETLSQSDLVDAFLGLADS